MKRNKENSRMTRAQRRAVSQPGKSKYKAKVDRRNTAMDLLIDKLNQGSGESDVTFRSFDGELDSLEPRNEA